jgi:hypothetical protein
MNGSYAVPGRKTPSNVFSGGLAKATVVFDGVSFQPLGVEPILDNQLPSDVHVPLFAHPAAVANSAVLTAVQTGFQACAISVAVATDPNIANCPQSNAVVGSGTNLQWSLVGDPLNSARLAFDGIRGDFTVTGSYAMQVTFDGATPDEHNMATVLGGYVATLSYDGTSLQLLSISGS